MLQATGACHLSSNAIIHGLACYATESVGLKTFVLRTTGHNHPGIKSACQRNPNLRFRFEITRKNRLKCLLKLSFIRLRRQSGLSLPGFRREISGLAAFTSLECPQRSSGQQLNVAKKGAVFEGAAEGEEFGHASFVKFPQLGKNSK